MELPHLVLCDVVTMEDNKVSRFTPFSLNYINLVCLNKFLSFKLFIIVKGNFQAKNFVNMLGLDEAFALHSP